MSDKRIITFAGAKHALRVGNVVRVVRGTRWQELKRLLCRPRILVVMSVSESSFTTVERRMTWREWFGALKNQL